MTTTWGRRRTARLPGTAGVAAALLPPEAGGSEPGEVRAALERYASALPAPVRTGVRVGALALQGFSLVTERRTLGRLPPEGRERVLARLARRPSTRPALDGLKALVVLVAEAERHAGDLLERSNRRPPARPDGDLDVTPSAWWPSRLSCDAVVVGSGAGGAMAARALARAGLDVVVVEEGRRFGVEEFRTRRPLDRFADLYRDGGSTVALGRPPIALPLGRGVGGTTLVNSGTCYRPPEAVMLRWRDAAGLSLADPEAFVPYLDEVEATLQVAPVPDAVTGRNNELALAGAEKLGWRAGPLLRNAPGCGGCCQCALGCPRNAKFGVHLNALPQACAAGARILSEARVETVLHEGGRATGVLATRSDGSRLLIRAPRVIVAAGATETPPLLRRSGLGDHPELGRNLAVHPAVAASGRFDEPVLAWHGVLQGAAVEEFHAEEGILVEATATPPGLGSMAFPGYGRALVERLAEADHYASLGAMVADAPRGRVLGRRRAYVRYDLSPDDGARLVRAVEVMGRVLLAAGATEVLTGFSHRPVVHDEGELEDAVGTARSRALHVAAFHPTGTAGAGADAARYPVDPSGALRGVAGVFVTDASILPSCPEVNPQVSIMALALAVADALVSAG